MKGLCENTSHTLNASADSYRTADAMKNATENWIAKLYFDKTVIVAFLNRSKAFDNINNAFLIEKLLEKCCDPMALKLVENYF